MGQPSPHTMALPETGAYMRGNSTGFAGSLPAERLSMAIKQFNHEVRSHPTDAKRRTVLFRLLYLIRTAYPFE
jgi:hypothetical protein